MINIFWPYYNKNGISDQLYGLVYFFKRNGLKWRLSNKLCTYCTNITIENFNQDSSKYITEFCELHQIKIKVLVTEFLTKNSRHEYFVNDIKSPLKLDNIDKTNKMSERFFFLNKISKYIDSFISILNIPNLVDYKNFFGVDNIYSIDLGFFSKYSSDIMPIYDFYFSGAITNHREEILKDLSKDFKLFSENKFVSDYERRINISKCKYSLNIPQSPSWKGDSLMRVLFSLSNNKPVISLNRNNIYMGELSDYIICYEDALSIRRNFKNVELSIPNSIHTNQFGNDETALILSFKSY
jgi:hypothetical protein